MQLGDATRKRIKNLLKEKNMKPYELTKAAGIAMPTLTDFMNNNTKNLRMDTLLHLCEGFNITLSDFFNDSLFNDVISE
ncbi:MAG: helix-turn-helix transcriptional regulator [Clostridiales bacterium]|nr:helix-turn-helix transcriptional regulator [Clostridiales bacterium]